jgi:hypothetical protein
LAKRAEKNPSIFASRKPAANAEKGKIRFSVMVSFNLNKISNQEAKEE